MKTLKYLQENFLTFEELAQKSSMDVAVIVSWQNNLSMPLASYRSQVHHTTSSFFGDFIEQRELHFYPLSYLNWLGCLQQINVDPVEAKEIFKNRYLKQAQKLYEDQMVPAIYLDQENYLNLSTLGPVLEKDWESFLAGIYGLCSSTGLPEDIVGKEFATVLIDQITDKQQKTHLSEDEDRRLRKAVYLLDVSSAQFAPHERARSSRYRCVDQVIQKYQLKVGE